MKPDSELELWRREWQAETAVPADLRGRVERQSRSMRILLLGDILVTVVIGGGVTAWALRAPQPDKLVLAVATWVFIAIAWAFGMANRRGIWSPAALNTSAFLDLCIRRCRAMIVATSFGTALYFGELLFCLAWIYHHLSQRAPLPLRTFLGSGTVLFVWACTALFIGFVVWYRRRKQAELRYLLDLRQELHS